MPDLFRSTGFRWALGIAAWTTVMALTMFAFVYWQTADFMREELAETLRLEVRAAAAQPAAATERVETWIAMDRHATHYAGLFGPDGTRRAGNLVGARLNLPAAEAGAPAPTLDTGGPATSPSPPAHPPCAEERGP